METHEYETVRTLICLAYGSGNDCEYCPLFESDNCYEHSVKSEEVLLALFGRRPSEDGESEKEECRSDAAAKHRVDMIVKALRNVQAINKINE